jgi:hypothetical protein
MRSPFSRIATRDEALKAITVASGWFFAFGALAALIGLILAGLAIQPDQKSYLPAWASLDIAIQYLLAAAIVLAFAAVLSHYKSRIAAVILLAYSTLNLVAIFITPQPARPPVNSILGAVAVWAGARACLATFRLHGRLQREAVRQEPIAGFRNEPRADFISYQRGGVESTEATAAAARAVPEYDRTRWAALLKYDDDIARVAARIRPLGERWVDELAHAYLALNDKQYLKRIEERIFADARAEAATARARRDY